GECWRPGCTAVLVGPAEKSVLFNTGEVIGKGLSFLGANRSFLPQFLWVIERMKDPAAQRPLERIISPEPLQVRTADDLNTALYQAWTRRERGKTLIQW